MRLLGPLFVSLSGATKGRGPGRKLSPPTHDSAMPASQFSSDSLESLLKNLSVTDDGPNHEEILKHANNVLKSSKGHPRALHTKVVALLNLDRHEDALKVFTSPDGQKIAETTILERAYCLYKVGKLQEAVELAQKGGQDSRGLQHIAAQAVSPLSSIPSALAEITNVLMLSLLVLPIGEL